MKPTKKRPAKRKTAKRAVKTGSIEHKLMRLHNRIEKAYLNGGSNYKNIGDGKWVMNLINDIRNNNLAKLCREDFEKCNGLWRTYA